MASPRHPDEESHSISGEFCNPQRHEILHAHLPAVHKYFEEQGLNGSKKPNYFIIPVDRSDARQRATYDALVAALSKSFAVSELSASPFECGIAGAERFGSGIEYRCIAVHSGAVERVRDTLKSVLWHQGQTGGSAAPPLGAIISRVAPVAVRHFSLRHHGHFVPAIERAHSEIRTFTFAHQWYYRYRVHCGRLTDAPLPLQTFLDSVFDGCPNHIFLSTKFSSSRCKTALPIDLAHSADHEIVDIAKRSMAFSGYKARHENLQKYFLDNDPSSLAVEVPLWIEPREFSDYAEIFGTGECLTGHIDLLRVRRGRGGVPARIEVWDYKPNAVKEKYAVTQVFIYAFMLAARTGIALSSFSCGYFDETDAFTFEPGEVGSEIVKEFKYLKK